MKNIILERRVRTSAKTYTPGTQYSVSTAVLNQIGMFCDIEAMQTAELDISGILELKTNFFR